MYIVKSLLPKRISHNIAYVNITPDKISAKSTAMHLCGFTLTGMDLSLQDDPLALEGANQNNILNQSCWTFFDNKQ